MAQRRRRRRVSAQGSAFITYHRVRTADVYGGFCQSRMDAADPSLVQLASSIARYGLLQPIVVRSQPRIGRFALICGARRLAACRMLNMEWIDAVVVDLEKEAALALYLDEHAQHMTPCIVDEAEAIAKVGVQRLAKHSSCPEAAIKRRAALASLPAEAMQIAKRHRLCEQQVLPLLAVDSEPLCIEAARMIAERALSGEQACRLVRSFKINGKRFR